jgi:hypothetical protein
MKHEIAATLHDEEELAANQIMALLQNANFKYASYDFEDEDIKVRMI